MSAYRLKYIIDVNCAKNGLSYLYMCDDIIKTNDVGMNGYHIQMMVYTYVLVKRITNDTWKKMKSVYR